MAHTAPLPAGISPSPDDPGSDDQHSEPELHSGIRFRRVLPIAQLFLCAVLLFPYRATILLEVFGIRTAGGLPPATLTYNLDGTVKLRTSGEFDRWFKTRENAFDLVSALNLPAVFVFDVPYGILSSDHGYWTAFHIDYKTWRVITWPFMALPLWWLAGRGLEALQSARRKLISPPIGLLTTLISFLLMAGGTTLVIGFLFFSGKDRADHQFQVFIAGAGIWGVLGSFPVIAKLAQWRISRQATLTPH